MNKQVSWIVTFSILLASIGSATMSFAAPAQVVILRHGEKPDNGDDLNKRGYERANALPGLFETDPALTRYGAPVAIYAFGPTKKDRSFRAVETITPLANSLGIQVQDQFTVDELQPLVDSVMSNSDYDGKTVVICWEHDRIPPMVQTFGYNDAPTKWKKKVFDRLWILHFTGNKVTGFEDLPQNLLPGDSQQ
jgi:hypothetical protein